MSWFSDLFSSRPEQPQGQEDDAIDISSLPRPKARPKAVASRALPQFRATATDHAIGARGDGSPRARARVRAAFTPSRPVARPEMFAGRDKVLRTLIRSIEDQYLHVIVYGDRGFGKTSLLHVLQTVAAEAKYIVRYASCGEGTEFGALFRSILADIPLLYHSDYDASHAGIEAGQSLADLLPPGPPTVPQVSDLLGKISGTRVLIICDEFDREQSPVFRRSIAELIKNLSDKSVRVQLVIAGVAANLTELIAHIPSIQRNILGLAMPAMTREEVAELIRNGERESGMAFDPKAATMIDTVSYGSPYLVNLVSQHASMAAVDRDSERVEAQDVVQAIADTLEETSHRISAHNRHYVEKARAEGVGEVLAQLAYVSLRANARIELEKGAAGDVTEDALRALQAKFGLIEPVEGDRLRAWRFAEDGVPIYLWLGLAHQLALRDELTDRDDPLFR